MVVLNRCKIAEIQSLEDIVRKQYHFNVVFNDCDFSALPEAQREFRPVPGKNRFAFGNYP